MEQPDVARIFTSGCELQSLSTASGSPDGAVSSVTNVTVETSLQRSGAACWKVAPTTSTPAYVEQSFTGANATNYYFRAYVMIPNQAAATATTVLRVLDNAAATLKSAGVVTGTATGTTFGTDGFESAEVPYGTWTRLEMLLNISASAGSDDTIEMLVDGVTVRASSLQALSTGPPAFFRVGHVVAPGTSKIIYVDDIAINDGSGAAQTSYPGSGKIVLLKPISLNTNGGSWTDDAAATTSAALTNAIDNTPPKGIADTVAGGGDHQVRNAAANTSLDMNLTTYATAGIKATDTIKVLLPICNTGAPVVTAAKTGSLGITTNPTIANVAFANGATAAANFWSGVTAGTYPTGWKWEKGTTTYGSSVTVGSSPVARVTITGGTVTRIAMVDELGLYVDYTPALAPPFQARTARNMLLRR